MAEPVIELPSTTRYSRRTLDNCRWKIERFVEHDAYVSYDYGAGYRLAPSNAIAREQIDAMNRVMMARSPSAAWHDFIGVQVPELDSIPYELDLIDSPDDIVSLGLESLAELTRRITSTPGLTDMAVSKVLYLLRPRFVGISDSYVRLCLGVRE